MAKSRLKHLERRILNLERSYLLLEATGVATRQELLRLTKMMCEATDELIRDAKARQSESDKNRDGSQLS